MEVWLDGQTGINVGCPSLNECRIPNHKKLNISPEHARGRHG